MARLIESVVEDAALAWLESLGYTVRHGPEIASEGITLVALRDTLLSKLLSGELQLKRSGD